MLRTRTSDYTMAIQTFGSTFITGKLSLDSFIPDQDEWAEMNAFDDYDVDLKILN